MTYHKGEIITADCVSGCHREAKSKIASLSKLMPVELTLVERRFRKAEAAGSIPVAGFYVQSYKSKR